MPQVVDCLMSLRDWQAAAQQAGLPGSGGRFSLGGGSSVGGSPYTSPSPTRGAGGGSVSGSPTRVPAGFSFTPIAQVGRG